VQIAEQEILIVVASLVTLKIIDQRRSARLSGNLAEYRRLNRERNAAISSDQRKFWND